MKLKIRKALAAVMTFVLTVTLVFTTFSSLITKTVVFAQTVLLSEEFNSSSWQTNPSLFGKSTNLLQGALDPNFTQVQIISPSDGNDAYLIYKFSAQPGKVFSDINFAFKGRAYTNTYVKFYGSTDNSSYQLITQLSSTSGSDPDANFNTGTRTSDMSVTIGGSSTAYLKVVMKSNGNPALLTWACLDFLTANGTEVDASQSVASKPLGVLFDENFDSAAWQANPNLVASSNIQQGSMDYNICVYPASADNDGILVYKIKTDENMKNLRVDFAGRVINTLSGAPTQFYDFSHIEFQFFNSSTGWASSYDYKGWGVTGDFANMGIMKSTTFSSEVVDQNVVYLMIKIRSSNSTQASWAALNSLKITTAKEKVIPVVYNGEVVNEKYDDSNWENNALLKNQNNIARGNVLAYNVVGPANASVNKTGYMVYNIKTDKPMSTMKAFITGRTIAYNGTSSIRILASDTETGVYSEIGIITATNSDSATDQYFETEREMNLTSAVVNKNEIFIKIEITTAGGPGAETWACLNSLRLVTTKEKTVPTLTNGILIDETFNDGSFVSNDSLVSFDNVKSDVLDSINTGIKVLRPVTLGRAAELVYQIKTEEPMETLSAEIAGRLISQSPVRYSSIEILTSTDGAAYDSAWKIQNNTLDNAYSFLSAPRTVSLNTQAQGRQELYIKIIVESAGLEEGSATWGSMDSFRLVSTKAVVIPVLPNGVIINETFDSTNWESASSNLMESSNLKAGIALDSNNQGTVIVSSVDKSKAGTMIFQIRTDVAMDRMMVEYTGRVISNNPSLYSSIVFQVSDDGVTWRPAGEDKGNALDISFSFLTSSRSVDLSEEVYEKNRLFLKIEVFSVSDTWGCLNSLKITTTAVGQSVVTGYIPTPSPNGTLLDENFENANWMDRTYNVDNTENTLLDVNNRKMVLSPKPGIGNTSTGSVTYAVRTSQEIGPVFIEYAGRAIRGSTLEFLISLDGLEWETVSIMHSPDNGEFMDFYSGFNEGRSIDITSFAKRSTGFYIKVRMDSKNGTWAALSSIKIKSQNVPDQIPVSKAVNHGVLINNNFDANNNNWISQALEVYNLKRADVDIKDTNNNDMVLFPVDTKSPAHIIYGFRTKGPFGSLLVEYTGRAIVGSKITILVSDDKMTWEPVYDLTSPVSGEDKFINSDMKETRTVDLTPYAKGRDLFYIKFQIQSGFESWASLNSVKIYSTKGTAYINTNINGTVRNSAGNTTTNPGSSDPVEKYLVLSIWALAALLISAGTLVYYRKI